MCRRSSEVCADITYHWHIGKGQLGRFACWEGRGRHRVPMQVVVSFRCLSDDQVEIPMRSLASLLS